MRLDLAARIKVGNVTDFSPAAVTAAIEENLFAFLTGTGGWARVEVHDEEELLWTASDFPFPSFNVVCRARLAEARVDAAIEAAIALYRARGVPALWLTGPSTVPSGLGEALAEHGFVLEERAAGMAVALSLLSEESPAGPMDLRIELVTGDAAMDVWSGTCARAGELPESVGSAFADLGKHLGYGGPNYYYLAYLDGAPVATLTLFLTPSVAGFYDGGTIPEARRRGIFGSLMRTAMQEARRQGYDLGVLHASGMSSGQCRRLGFKEYCTIDEFVWEPEAGYGTFTAAD
jgi:hypothetical protein